MPWVCQQGCGCARDPVPCTAALRPPCSRCVPAMSREVTVTLARMLIPPLQALNPLAKAQRTKKKWNIIDGVNGVLKVRLF